MIDPQNFVACLQSSSSLEVIAVVFALLYVILASYEKVWCWPAAAISTCIYIFICYKANLLLETVLQIFYLFMAFYGWYEWVYGKREEHRLYITSFPFSKIILWLIAGIPLVMLTGYLFGNYFHASYPYLDGQYQNPRGDA